MDKDVTQMTFDEFIRMILEYMDSSGMLDDLKKKFEEEGAGENNGR